jgi:predicted MFS family arabinose efflux permease
MSYTQSLNLLLILNGVGVVGRLVLGHLADRFGIFFLLVPTTLTVGVLTYSWYAVHSASAFYVWTCIYSIAASGFQTLFPTGLKTIVTVDAE